MLRLLTGCFSGFGALTGRHTSLTFARFFSWIVYLISTDRFHMKSVQNSCERYVFFPVENMQNVMQIGITDLFSVLFLFGMEAFQCFCLSMYFFNQQLFEEIFIFFFACYLFFPQQPWVCFLRVLLAFSLVPHSHILHTFAKATRRRDFITFISAAHHVLSRALLPPQDLRRGNEAKQKH